MSSCLFHDPVLAALQIQVETTLGKLSPIAPLGEDLYFRELVESVISQQLATKAALKICERVHQTVGQNFTPTTVLNTSHENLRQAGLSQSKAQYIHNIAEAWNTGVVVPAALTKMSDTEVISCLTTIKGIGRWTAEMFLISGLGRPDVFSGGDYGLRKAMMKAYDLPETTKQEVFVKKSENWQPHRTLASRILWKSLELPK